MKRYVALLRGINVGGKNRLPMADLRDYVAALGGTEITTYIQSGNVVFSHPDCDPVAWAGALTGAIGVRAGFAPKVLVLPAMEFQAAVSRSPFVPGNPKDLHLYFLTGAPTKPDLARANASAIAGEEFAIMGRVFYLHAPDGIARSKLAAQVERIMGLPATARNWRSVQAILALI